MCNCGRPAALKKVTDRSKETYGRWFWGCKNFNDRKRPCRFFEWYDADEPEPGHVSGDLQRASDGSYRCLICNQNVVLDDGEHRCRLYGTYHCVCGNRWTSGYTWSEEEQQCRSCGYFQHPDHCQQLRSREGARRGRGPHDCEACGMCQHLGYPCHMAARPGEPGFMRSSRGHGYHSGGRYMPY